VQASPYCIPCIINQITLVAEKAHVNKQRRNEVISRMVDWLSAANLDRTPAEIAYDCLARVYKMLGVSDPFRADKQQQYQYVLAMEKALRKELTRTRDPLFAILKCAITGNLIDSLLLKHKQPNFAFTRFFKQPLGINHYPAFKRRLKTARHILYILDNMGESFFDKLAIEQLLVLGKSVTCVVRQGPVLNDVTLEDARRIGLTRLVEIIRPGVGAIGLPLNLASPHFKKIFKNADLVISKGQANFETLEGIEKSGLFFLFVVKCPTVAKCTSARLGTNAFLYNKYHH
jgi:damage-control phosphatase, subfamily I